MPMIRLLEVVIWIWMAYDYDLCLEWGGDLLELRIHNTIGTIHDYIVIYLDSMQYNNQTDSIPLFKS